MWKSGNKFLLKKPQNRKDPWEVLNVTQTKDKAVIRRIIWWDVQSCLTYLLKNFGIKEQRMYLSRECFEECSKPGHSLGSRKDQKKWPLSEETLWSK